MSRADGGEGGAEGALERLREQLSNRRWLWFVRRGAARRDDQKNEQCHDQAEHQFERDGERVQKEERVHAGPRSVTSVRA